MTRLATPQDKVVCRDCKAPVIWARTTNAKLMPVNAATYADGNLVLEEVAKSTPLAVQYDAAKHGADYPLRRISHFATCSAAEERRKPR